MILYSSAITWSAPRRTVAWVVVFDGVRWKHRKFLTELPVIFWRAGKTVALSFPPCPRAAAADMFNKTEQMPGERCVFPAMCPFDRRV